MAGHVLFKGVGKVGRVGDCAIIVQVENTPINLRGILVEEEMSTARLTCFADAGIPLHLMRISVPMMRIGTRLTIYCFAALTSRPF